MTKITMTDMDHFQNNYSMKKCITLIAILTTFNVFSQAHIGAMGGYNFDNEKLKLVLV